MTTPTIKDIRAAAAARRARRVRNRRLLIGAVVALLALGVLSWWVVPVVVRSQLEHRGSELLARPVTVERVAFNPLGPVVTIDGLRVGEPDGGDWLGWERLRVDLRLWSLVRGRLGFDAIELKGFDGRVAVDATGRVNFADLLVQAEVAETDAAADAEPTLVEIGSLVVTDARIAFSDDSHAQPFATTLGPVSFSLEDFHTIGDPNAPYQFVAATEAGERLSWSGRLSATPLRSEGSIQLSGLQVAKYAPYYAAFTSADVRSGTLRFGADYAVAVTDGELDLKVAQGEVGLDQLVVGAPGVERPALSAQALTAKGISLDWAAQQLEVGELGWETGQVRLERRADGIDLVNLLAPRASDEAGADSDSDGLRVHVGQVKVDQVGVFWRDETLATPGEVAIERLSVGVDDLDLSDLSHPVRLGAVVALADGGGVVQVSGETGLVPFRPALELKVNGLAIGAAGAYLEDAADLVVPEGKLTLAGSLGTAGDDLVFRGDVDVAGVRLQNPAGGRLAAWESLRGEGLSVVASDPLALEVENVRWVRPDLSVAIDRDGSLNWLSAATEEPPAEVTVTVPPAVAGPGPVLRVNRVELVEARVDFRDGSLVLPAGAVLTDLSGELTGLSSVELGKGRAELHGKANGSGAVAITGDFNPLGRPAFTDLQLRFDRVDLSPLGGYVGHYAGLALQRGRMSLDVDLKLEDRRIDSETVVTLDDFTLGRKVASPDATSLPVSLALKLLRDVDGQIVIDLPVKGDLDDPEFRIGRVVWRVITNLLTKAATAPFAMLGAIAGGGSAADNLDEQAFAAASAELAPDAIQKLDTLAEALAARPALQLGIQGQYAPEADAMAWKPIVLENRLRERAAAGEWSAATGWADGARGRQLVGLYLEVFGEPPVDPEATIAAVSAAAEAEGDTLTAATPVQPPADETLLGWLRRVFGGNTAAGRDEAEVRAEPAAAEAGEQAPVLALLPETEIERRLLQAVEIEPAQLRELAQARAAAVQAHLVAAGVARERMAFDEPAAGEARVTLELR